MARSHKQAAAKLVVSAREALDLGGVDLLGFLDKREAAYRRLLKEDRHKDSSQKAIGLIESIRAELFQPKPDWRHLFFELFALTGERIMRIQNPLQLQSRVASVGKTRTKEGGYENIRRAFDAFRRENPDWHKLKPSAAGENNFYSTFKKSLERKGETCGYKEVPGIETIKRALKGIYGPARSAAAADAARRAGATRQPKS